MPSRAGSLFLHRPGSVLPVQEPIPVGKRGVREGLSRTGGLFLHRRWGKHASRTGTHSRWQAWATGRFPSCAGALFLHRRGVQEACFPYGIRFPLASVGYGKVAFPYGNPVSAQAWVMGSMLPVREPIPVGKRGLREGCLPVREPCSCTCVGYGKHASRTGTHSRWQAWATGRLPSRTGTLFLHRRGVWEGHPVWGFKIIKAEGGGVGGVVGRPASIVCRLVSQTECASPACGRQPPSAQPPPPPSPATARRRSTRRCRRVCIFGTV